MLVLVVLLLFGIMAMAALVIDIGFARLTQRQMQTAVDAASLEGLRGSPAISYEQRQTNAEQMMGWLFDDDLDPSNGDDGIAGNGGQFGAGPLVDFSGGAGDPVIVASQFIEVDPSNPVYKPSIIRQNETPDAFKIELRRGAIDLSDANLISNGPSVPYLFARGSLVNRSSIANGITVRATAIANAQPVVCIGASNSRLLGIALSMDEWDAGVPVPWSATFVATTGIIGEAIGPSNTGTPPNVTGYVALYSTTALNRVIGFGYASVDATTGLVTNRPFDNVVPQIATENASAVFCRPLDTTIPSGELNVVFRERKTRLRDVPRTDILLAPVSGR